MELKGKVALITGGASGYGREYCLELFRQGCKVSGSHNIVVGVEISKKCGSKFKYFCCVCVVRTVS